MTYQDLLQIIELIKASSRFTEFHLKVGDIEVDLRRSVEGTAPPTAPAAPVAVPPAMPAAAALQRDHANADKAGAYPAGSVLVTAPMVGTFYRAPEPGAPPFVAIGQKVVAGTIVCIIEVMKLMNSIAAEQPGVVSHILVQDGEPVEFGQVLLVIEPQ